LTAGLTGYILKIDYEFVSPAIKKGSVSDFYQPEFRVVFIINKTHFCEILVLGAANSVGKKIKRR